MISSDEGNTSCFEKSITDFPAIFFSQVGTLVPSPLPVMSTLPNRNSKNHFGEKNVWFALRSFAMLRFCRQKLDTMIHGFSILTLKVVSKARTFLTNCILKYGNQRRIFFSTEVCLQQWHF